MPKARALLKTLRPHQWFKNLFVLALIFFHRDVFLKTSVGPALNLMLTVRALLAVFVFCLLSGAVYTINDLADADADRRHPIKRFRPIASGAISPAFARIFAPVLMLAAFALGAPLGIPFLIVAGVYFFENLAYSFRLKKIAYLDVALISFGFVLRVLAGGFATEIVPSGYLLSCTALVALLLGLGKRRYELASTNGAEHRSTLAHYSPRVLDAALAVTAVATAATYTVYSLDPATQAFFESDHLWLTAPFAALGILRFLYLTSGRGGRGLETESPTQEMLRDVPFLLNLIVWCAIMVTIVYQLRPAT